RRSADATAVQDQTPRRLYPVLPREDGAQVRLDPIGVRGLRQPQPAGHSSDMAVDRYRWDTEGGSQDDRGGLPPHAVERGERLHLPRDLAPVLVEKAPRHRTERLRLLVEEAGRFDLALELARGRSGVIGCGPVFLKEGAGDLVDPLVL